MAPGRFVTIVAAAYRTEDDHAYQPRRVCARGRENYHRHRACNATRQHKAETDKSRQHHDAGSDTDHRAGYVRRLQTSTTWKSVTASSTVPE